MKFFLLFFLLFPFSCFAQAESFVVQITEISPKKIGNEEEWFEFRVSGNGLIDISGWKFGQGNSLKTLAEKIQQLQFSFSGTERNVFDNEPFAVKIDINRYVFPLHNSSEIYFTWSVSPVSLPDNGGELRILNVSDQVLDRIPFAAPKSGTSEGNLYADIWNRHPVKMNTLFPLRYEQNRPTFLHSKGLPNFSPPTFPQDVQILFFESSPQRESALGPEFLEFFVVQTNENLANLKGLQMKFNGTRIFSFVSDFFVSPGEFLLLFLDGSSERIASLSSPYTLFTDKLSGLSAGSGTVELLLFSGTSWEQDEDFVCWQNGPLSQTEQNRVNQKITQGQWIGDCVDISNLIKNESVARVPHSLDTQKTQDFFRHFHGSPGQQNITVNNTPFARISVQGARRIYKTSLNFTGDQSFDPDGNHDLKSFLWNINGNSCPPENSGWKWLGDCIEESKKMNPGNIHFLSVGKYVVSLRVEDFSGSTHLDSVEIEVTEQGIDTFQMGFGGGEPSIFEESLKKWLEKEAEKTLPKNLSGETSSDFFDDFINSIDLENLDFLPQPPTSSTFVSPPQPLYARDRFTPEERGLMKKNLGLIFSKPW